MLSAAILATYSYADSQQVDTAIPVLTVYGRCDGHDHYPASFYVMSYVDEENHEERARLHPEADQKTPAKGLDQRISLRTALISVMGMFHR